MTQAASDLLHHRSRVLVLPQAHKLGVPQVVRIRPFEELNLGHNLRPNPNALLHLLGSQRLALAGLARLGQVDERHAEIAGGLRFSSPRKPVCSRKANVP